MPATEMKLSTFIGARRFDAVLMDCEMPVMDGFAATRLIREFEVSSGMPRTPIIALTANALKGDREYCLQQGMDDYLSKPIELHQLGVLVAKWLGGDQVAANAPSNADVDALGATEAPGSVARVCRAALKAMHTLSSHAPPASRPAS